MHFQTPAAAGLPPAIPNERDYISWSAIRTYQQCPLRYYFHYVAELAEETIAAGLVFGAAIHRALEYHFLQLKQDLRPPSVRELWTAYRSVWEEQGLPIRFNKSEDEYSLSQLAHRMLTAFVASDLARVTGKIVSVEESLRGRIAPGMPDLLGRIDLIVETENELVLSDWKTSRARYAPEQVAEAAPQLLLYGDIARDLAPGKQLRLEFGVFTKTKVVHIGRHVVGNDVSQLVRTKHLLERVWNAIEDGHFYPAPSLLNCAGCPYQAPCRRWPL